MTKALFLKADGFEEVCANCEKPYMKHYGDRLRCDADLSVDEPRWFPAQVANTLRSLRAMAPDAKPRATQADDCPYCPAKAGETCQRFNYDHPGHPRETLAAPPAPGN